MVAPGTRVRLRLINSDNTPQRFSLDGDSRFASSRSTEPT